MGPWDRGVARLRVLLRQSVHGLPNRARAMGLCVNVHILCGQVEAIPYEIHSRLGQRFGAPMSPNIVLLAGSTMFQPRAACELVTVQSSPCSDSFGIWGVENWSPDGEPRGRVRYGICSVSIGPPRGHSTSAGTRRR